MADSHLFADVEGSRVAVCSNFFGHVSQKKSEQEQHYWHCLLSGKLTICTGSDMPCAQVPLFHACTLALLLSICTRRMPSTRVSKRMQHLQATLFVGWHMWRRVLQRTVRPGLCFCKHHTGPDSAGHGPHCALPSMLCNPPPMYCLHYWQLLFAIALDGALAISSLIVPTAYAFMLTVCCFQQLLCVVH